jgi:hypothetical protein
MANRRMDREEYWRGIMEDWSESVLSQRRFCQASRISYWRFRVSCGQDRWDGVGLSV